MRKLLFLLIVGAGAWYWYHGSLPFLSTQGAFEEDGSPAVWIFTTKECGRYCADSIRELKKRKTPFKEIQIDPASPNDNNVDLFKRLGGRGLPFITVGNDNVTGSSKSQLATLLAKNFGTSYLTSTEKRYFKKHFNTDGSPRIVLYGADWCPSCKKLRKEFKEAGADFAYINVENHGERNTLTRVMEIQGYPAIWIGYTRSRSLSSKDIIAAAR